MKPQINADIDGLFSFPEAYALKGNGERGRGNSVGERRGFEERPCAGNKLEVGVWNPMPGGLKDREQLTPFFRSLFPVKEFPLFDEKDVIGVYLCAPLPRGKVC